MLYSCYHLFAEPWCVISVFKMLAVDLQLLPYVLARWPEGAGQEAAFVKSQGCRGVQISFLGRVGT